MNQDMPQPDYSTAGPNSCMPSEDPGNALVDYCRAFTAIKYRIDDFLDAIFQRFDSEVVTSFGLDWLDALGQDAGLDDQAWLISRCPEFPHLELRGRSLRYALAPDTYAITAFPFLPYISYPGSDALRLESIDPSLVIGSTYDHRWPDFLSSAELDSINEKVTRQFKGDDCTYVSLGSLPLYVAVEGKNRVRAFTNARLPLQGWHCSIDFPEMTALKLHRVVDPSSSYIDRTPIYLVSSSETYQYYVLPLPSITFPLLEAYGVPWGSPVDRGQGGRQAWLWQNDRRRALHRLIDDFNRP